MLKRIMSAFMSVVLALGLCPAFAFAQGGGLAVAGIDEAGLSPQAADPDLNPEILAQIEGWWQRWGGYAYNPADGKSYPDTSYIKDGYINTFAADFDNGGFKFANSRKIYAIEYGPSLVGDGWKIFTDAEKQNFYLFQEDSPETMASLWYPKGYSGTSSLARCNESSYVPSRTASPPDIGHADVAAIPDQGYTGASVRPALEVSLYGEPLQEGEDYTVSYSDDVGPGVATALIEGIGNYRGVKAVNYLITAPPSTGDLIISRDTWGFKNPSLSIPANYYYDLFGTSLGSQLYQSYGGTGGVCYGMVATSQAIDYAGFPAVSSYDVGGAPAGALSDVPEGSVSSGAGGNGLSVLDYVSYGWLSQMSDGLSSEREDNVDQYQGLVDAVKRFQDEGGVPVCIAIFAQGEGHALWGVEVEEGEESTSIRVYDCNHPGDGERYLELFKDEYEYTGWQYDLGFGVWTCPDDPESFLSWTTPYDDLQVLLNGGGIGVAGPTAMSNDDLCIVRTPVNASIKLGSEYYELSPDADDEDVLQVRVLSDEPKDSDGSRGECYWVNGSSRQFEFDSPGEQGSMGIAFADASLDIATSEGAHVTGRAYGPKNSLVELDQSYGDEFSVTYHSENAGSIAGSDELSVKGVSDGDVEVKQSRGGIAVKGASAITVNNGAETVTKTGLDSEKSYTVAADDRGAIEIAEPIEEVVPPVLEEPPVTPPVPDNTPGVNVPSSGKTPSITVKTKSKTVKAKDIKKKGKSFKIGAKSSSGGKLTYKVTKANKRITFKNGKATLKKKTKPGTYSIKVKVTTAAKGAYKSDSKTFTIKFKVKK